MRLHGTRLASISYGRGLGNLLWDLAGAPPSLDQRFAESRSLIDAVSGQQLITYTRVGDGTFVGSNGLIQTAGNDVPRFDHNPTTGESLGLLVEEQRANLLLHNRTLTNAAWVATNITTAKDQIGADGVSNSASSITASAGNGTILQTITSASAARATSAHVKRITGTGTIQMTQDNGSTWTAVTVTTGWTRVTIPSATVANPVVGFRIVTSGDAIAVDYVQCESGAFSTSAIETTTATVTRSADVVSITGSAFSSWYRQDEGTVFVEAQRSALIASTQFSNLWSASDNTANERFIVYNTGSSQTIDAVVTDGGVSQAGLVAPGAISANSSIKTVLAFRPNDFALIRNAGIVQIDTSGTLPTVDRIYIGANSTGAGQWTGTMSRLTYWPQRLSNTTLQALTQ